MKRAILSSKRLWVALALLLVIATAVALLWPKPPPQFITLPTGEKLVFAGVTYGTNFVPPSLPCQIAAHLPNGLVRWAEKIGLHRLSWTIGINHDFPQLIVWFRQGATNAINSSWYPFAGARLADESGYEGGATVPLNRSLASDWYYAAFSILPHRSPGLQCVIDDQALPTQDRQLYGRVIFRNPRYGHFLQWQPEPLPDTKTTGDLSAMLEDVKLGVLTRGFSEPVPGKRPEALYRPATPGENVVTGYRIAFTSSHGTNELWYSHAAELSDPTGNRLSTQNSVSILPFDPPGRLNAPNQSWPFGGANYDFPLPGTLWPDEHALRLKIYAKRVSGFAPDEFITFKNVPIPPVRGTNFVPITNYFKGRPVILWTFLHQPDMIVVPGKFITQPSSIIFNFPGLTRDTAIDVVSISTGTTNLTVNEYDDIYFGCGAYPSAIPTNATKLDITLVIQKTRAFEFYIKPPLPK